MRTTQRMPPLLAVSMDHEVAGHKPKHPPSCVNLRGPARCEPCSRLSLALGIRQYECGSSCQASVAPLSKAIPVLWGAWQ